MHRAAFCACLCGVRGLCDIGKGSHYDNCKSGQKYLGYNVTVVNRLLRACTEQRNRVSEAGGGGVQGESV